MKPLARLKPKKETPESVSKEDNTGHPLENVLLTSPNVVMIYGDADPEYGVSTAYYRTFSEEKGFPLDIRTIEGANHNFYSMEWKHRLTEMLQNFIEEI